jgi:photosystem II stability/assembly factor-like uncharacterized protein
VPRCLTLIPALLLAALAAEAQPYYPQVYFKGSRGFLLSDSGRVYQSRDGGSSWQVKSLGDSAYVRGIHFPADQVGYMVGTTTLLKTTDGGETWTRPAKVRSMLTQVAFLDAEVGLAVGVATLLRTEDGGAETHSDALSSPTGPMTFRDVAFPAPDAALVVGLDGWIRKSPDAGRTWKEIASPVTADLEAVYFPTASVGYAVGEDGAVVKTSDAGETWTAQNSGVTDDLKDVHFRDAQNGWAVGGGIASSLMLYTQDGGATWKKRNQPASYPLTSICFVDANRGFASGSTGDFIMTSDGGLTWGRRSPAAVRGGSGARNRGPRRKDDRIEYSLAAPVRVEARLFDASGREARVLFAGDQAAGNHSLRLSGSGPAAGGYFLDFRAAGLRQALPLRGN